MAKDSKISPLKEVNAMEKNVNTPKAIVEVMIDKRRRSRI